MENKPNCPDWGKLSPCDIGSTLAFTNAKKIFRNKTDTFCRIVAALAVIEDTFDAGYSCSLTEIKGQLCEKFLIQESDLEDCFVFSPILFESQEADDTTTSKWLSKLCHVLVEEWTMPYSVSNFDEFCIADSVNIDEPSFSLSRRLMDHGIPFRWVLISDDDFSARAYVCSLFSHGLPLTWNEFSDPEFYSKICRDVALGYFPIIKLPKKKYLFSSDLRKIEELNSLVEDMGFSIGFVVDKGTDVFADSVSFFSFETLIPALSNAIHIAPDVFGSKTASVVAVCEEFRIPLFEVVRNKRMINRLLACSSDDEVSEVVRLVSSVKGIGPDKKEDSDEYSRYSTEVLNTSIPITHIIQMIKKHDWDSRRGQKLLFYGQSGTGKTAFADYIASSLSMKVIHAKPSDVLGRMLGETEQNIAELFAKATKDKAILQIDEIDSFLVRRSPNDINIRVTTGMVNQFLQEIEAFNGILIGTSNLLEAIDPAFMRRFNRIVEFRYLTEDGIRILLKKYFPTMEFTESQIRRLSGTGAVGPGDFESVYSTSELLEPEDLSSESIVDEILGISETRVGKAHRQIGFAV